MTLPPHDGRRPGRPPAAELPGPDDAALARAVADLQRLPGTPPDVVDRVVAAALVRNGMPGHRPAAAWLARAAVVVAAAGLGAATARYGVRPRDPAPAPAAARPAAPAPPSIAQPVAAGAADDAPVPTGFVISRPDARTVALVGDFNGWDTRATPMTRDARGVWTATVHLAPGRHAYVFVVDDSLWVTDPRAEIVRDPDYGRDQSAIVVGRP